MKDHDKKIELHKKYKNHRNLLSTLIKQSKHKYLNNILKIIGIYEKYLEGDKKYNFK